ncbi:ATP-grasp domain-containing protein [Nocardia sp. CDC159]|uniref:ATP-grasp domain-containing protein n=1 Tax=Nocardia pulmonis TaxID=2951408 RepID=A0A9X2IZD1_9NOCA|nr:MULTISPECIES: ATP-grasp domain-containing protein [Nocardia]MCM6775900.1 ATP-grasp domain-containing protein [Nocardia pulmonis]MCM6788124.1 ATP-grasp domain-containing protein [Nocardia sp. CDC159]
MLVVVDPFSSGGVLARRAKELYGIDSVAVITTTALPANSTARYAPADYVGEVRHTDIVETVLAVERLCGGRPDHIVCGSEPGVEVFDALAAHWILRPNFGPSTVRRDMFPMHRRLREAGLRYLPQYRSAHPESVVAWCADSGSTEFVVQPVESCAPGRVHICSGVREVRAACVELLERPDHSGAASAEVLVRERIAGPEFVVDTVSLDGSHFVVALFRYAEEIVDGTPIPRTLSSAEIDEQPGIVEYVERVLDALGIENGPAHSSVVLTEQGPTLIRTAARMHGGLGPRLVAESSTHSLIDLALAARISAADFLRKTDVRPRLRRKIVECFLAVSADGTVAANRVHERCRELDSYLFDTCAQLPGDRVARTADPHTSYGSVILANSDQWVLLRDVERVLEWDRRGALLELAPAT